ncbi:MAG TPA: hypothetical protein VM791_15440 [Vicinamibacterales bacterium]|jgi:hypothetical protein|nr:hypothetical protein [Vicinamibacterales bacterium]
MATRADVQRFALSLPGAEKAVDHFAFGVRKKGKLKGFAWVWMERVESKKSRVPNPRVLAVRVANLAEKNVFSMSFGKNCSPSRTTKGFRRCSCVLTSYACRCSGRS